MRTKSMRLRAIPRTPGRTLLPAFLVTIAFLVTLPAGCLRHNVRNGGVRPEYRPMEKKSYTVIDTVTAESSSFRLFWVIPVTRRLSFDEAALNAISDRGGDNLIDLQWWFERRYWVVGTVDVLFIRGKVIRYGD